MKIRHWLRLATLTVFGLGTINLEKLAIAATFTQKELNQNKVIAIAAPISGGSSHQLLILEQISNKRSCWREIGNSPTKIELLLLNFDFTGICGRSIDSNGYSVRVAGNDLGWRYALRLVRHRNDIKLVATPTSDPTTPEIEIGSTKGITNDFAKIILNPGWRLTKRVYNGRTLGHLYLTNNQDLRTLIASASRRRLSPSRSVNVVTTTQNRTSDESLLPQPPQISKPTQPSNISISTQGDSGASPWIEFPNNSTPQNSSLPTIPVNETSSTIDDEPPPPPPYRAAAVGFNYRVIVPAATPGL
ncbi:MAG: DUF3747 domain-containing protein, partial [Moorea sp. SIO2B7]|nr:DUF3747 domain-containing protein [Moorena sp. SIO2B7]